MQDCFAHHEQASILSKQNRMMSSLQLFRFLHPPFTTWEISDNAKRSGRPLSTFKAKRCEQVQVLWHVVTWLWTIIILSYKKEKCWLPGPTKHLNLSTKIFGNLHESRSPCLSHHQWSMICQEKLRMAAESLEPGNPLRLLETSSFFAFFYPKIDQKWWRVKNEVSRKVSKIKGKCLAVEGETFWSLFNVTAMMWPSWKA